MEPYGIDRRQPSPLAAVPILVVGSTHRPGPTIFAFISCRQMASWDCGFNGVSGLTRVAISEKGWRLMTATPDGVTNKKPAEESAEQPRRADEQPRQSFYQDETCRWRRRRGIEPP